MRSLMCACLSCWAYAQTWPIPYEASPDTLPNIELHLVPPVHPFPQVAAEEEQFEFACNAISDNAKRQVGEAVGTAMKVFDDPWI